MDTSETVRTHEKERLDKMLRFRMKEEKTISRTQILDELIKKEFKRLGLTN